MNVVLEVDGAVVDGPAAGIHLFQAVDRPARLEVELAPGGAFEARGDGRPRIGSRVAMRAAGRSVFHGVLERWGERMGAAEGRRRWLVAYDDYHRLRDVGPVGPWYQATDSEVAERVASALELVSRVEPTAPVHAVVEAHGDPLKFLRARARRCGFELAVWDGRLHFARTIAADGEPVVVRREQLLRCELEERRRARSTYRLGRIELAGDWRLRPLLALDLEGLDGAGAGRYRSVRALHALDRSGFRTRVEMAADGLECFQDSESEILDLHQ